MNTFGLTAISANQNSDEGIKHAVLQSLLNYAKAQKNDPIEKHQNKQGWWANQYVKSIGCRDWTLARSKQTQETLNRAKNHTKKALQWLIDDSVIKATIVKTHYENDRLIRQIIILKNDNSQTEITL